jgi:hypothetical protein
MRTLFHRGLGGVVIAALLILGCSRGEPQPKGEKPSEEGKGGGGPQAGARKPDFTLTAEEFTREFLKDKDAAKKKYEGKRVEITGEVSGVSSPDAGKTAVVQLQGAKKDKDDIVGTLVQVALRPEFTRTGLHLSSKQKVKVTADYEIFLSFFVNLANGSLEELSKSELVSVGAPELAREFAKDAKAAAAKYTNKELLVTGEVEQAGDERGFHYVRLKGDGKTGVRVGVGSLYAQHLKKGATLGLRIPRDRGVEFEKNEVRLGGGSVVEAK